MVTLNIANNLTFASDEDAQVNQKVGDPNVLTHRDEKLLMRIFQSGVQTWRDDLSGPWFITRAGGHCPFPLTRDSGLG